MFELKAEKKGLLTVNTKWVNLSVFVILKNAGKTRQNNNTKD